MVVLAVIASLAALLAVGCFWEARTGRPEWRSRPRVDDATRRAGARSAGLSGGTAYWISEGGSGDGG